MLRKHRYVDSLKERGVILGGLPVGEQRRTRSQLERGESTLLAHQAKIDRRRIARILEYFQARPEYIRDGRKRETSFNVGGREMLPRDSWVLLDRSKMRDARAERGGKRANDMSGSISSQLCHSTTCRRYYQKSNQFKRHRCSWGEERDDLRTRKEWL